VVVPLGASAFKALCGETKKITEWANRPFVQKFDDRDVIMFPTWSPAYVMRNDHLMEEWFSEFGNIMELSNDYEDKVVSLQEGGIGDYTVLTDYDRCCQELKRFHRAGKQGKVIAFDLETTGLQPYERRARIGVLSMSVKVGTASVFIWDHDDSSWTKREKRMWLKKMGQFFSKGYKFVGQNAKFDAKWVYAMTGIMPQIHADTQLMHHILMEEKGTHGLKVQAVRYTNMGAYEDELDQHIPDKNVFGAFLKPPIPVVAQYAGCDADCTLRLYNTHKKEIDKHRPFERLAFDFLPRASTYLTYMEAVGAKVDVAYAQEYLDELVDKCDELYAKIRENEAVQAYTEAMDELAAEEYKEYRKQKRTDFKERLREWKELYAEHLEKCKEKHRAKLREWRALKKQAEAEGKRFNRKKPEYRETKFNRVYPEWSKVKLRKEPEPFEFNVGSPDQMRAVLFDYIGHDPVGVTDSGQDSTDKETLLHYKYEEECAFSAVVLDYRVFSKLANTYVKAIVEKSQGYSTGHYIYGSFNMTSTVTGRLSATNPNLQNIPHKGAGGVKRCYISRWTEELVEQIVTEQKGELAYKKLCRDWKKRGLDGRPRGMIMQVDYSQIELRLAAGLSKDRVMLNLYRTGKDIHTNTCCGIYDFTVDDYHNLESGDRKEKRRVAKVYNFGILYGMGAEGVVASLKRDDPPMHLSVEEGREGVEKFHETYKQLSKWIDKTKDGIRSNGYLDSPFGRRRRLPQTDSIDEGVVARALRQGVNHPIQSGASDMTLTSGTLISEYLREEDFMTLPFATVHDSILFDVFPGEMQDVMDVCEEVMTNLPKYGGDLWGDDFDWSFLRCPIEVGFDVGWNWRDLVELGEPDHEENKVETWDHALRESTYKMRKADGSKEREIDPDEVDSTDIIENAFDEAA